MSVVVSPVKRAGLELWRAAVVQDGRVLHVVERWSERGATADAWLWCARHQ